ncbi:MAG: hypothetical protein CL609_05550 [Anaerolineaceae bacterium]|nr:hypothetical protein [Anaerolineaceae bacterium]
MKGLLTFKWILTTILVLIGVGVMVRLGIWQLDRLKWRQSFNEHYLAQINAPAVDLNIDVQDSNLVDMEYREILVNGVYDFKNEVYLQNQVYDGLPGYHVLTPLIINNGESAVIVNRGWIPLDFSESEIKEFQPQGNVSISGVIRLGLVDTTFKNGLGTLEDDGTIRYWKYINLEKLSEQIPYKIESIYIEKTANENERYPVPAFKEIEITQGPHLGYAIQWFFFAALLGGGYPAFIRKTLGEKKQNQQENKGE